jgi:hypothetical protein
MAYDARLAERVQRLLVWRKGVTEKKMFGGLAFMLHGKMFCGVLKDDLVVRVGPVAYEKALSRTHARPMDFTGRPLKGYVFVGPGGSKTDKMLAKWIEEGVEFASSLTRKQDALESDPARCWNPEGRQENLGEVRGVSSRDS